MIIGLKEGGSSWDKAKNDGHEVMSVVDACKKADIIHILIPDMVQSKVYKDEIEPNLSDGNALAFSSLFRFIAEIANDIASFTDISFL